MKALTTKAKKKSPSSPKRGRQWMNPISGLLYRWDARKQRWVSTGIYPYGANPMGFLGDSAQ